MLEPYIGCLPGVYKRDAKYSIVSSDGEWLIRLIWPAPNWDRIELLAKGHDDLVGRINRIKQERRRVFAGAASTSMSGAECWSQRLGFDGLAPEPIGGRSDSGIGEPTLNLVRPIA